ncbi:hypothetical protein GGR58DRAFT_504965 [Xylaria digitata]|nr:hypothetical protein GGR58DRAFT_504965 [Xylaria digitata]
MATAEVTARALQGDAIAQIANASALLRKAISAAIPVGPEQYMTISVPGTVIDTRDLTEGGAFFYGAEYSAFPPLQVHQAEARLVDGLMPLSNIMVGNTGKSAARSYSRALDGLVPKKATIRDGDPINPIRSPGEPGYDAAMSYLTTPLSSTSETPVEIYIEKQSLWAEAQDAWDKAKIKAQREAKLMYPSDVVLQRQYYEEWSQANYRKHKFAAQGQWVLNGHKYNVEFNFGMVDTESIMARVESSKESLRNSTIVDADGVNEVQGVNLTPKNWALLCQQKARDWFKRNGTYSLEQVEAEIARLNQLKLSYQAMRATINAQPPQFPIYTPGENKPGSTDENGDGNIDSSLSTAFEKLYAAEGALAGTNPDPNSDDYKRAAENLATARAVLDEEVKNSLEAHLNLTKSQLENMEGSAKDSVETWLDGQINIITDQITKLEAKREEKQVVQPVRLPAYVDASTEIGTASSWGMSVGGGADSQNDMASCDVSVTFDALVVNINRPWLYAELFNDFELDVADNILLSPSAERLKNLMAAQAANVQTGVDVGSANPSVLNELAQYNTLASYPTSFIVAANTSLEFHGNTQHI